MSRNNWILAGLVALAVLAACTAQTSDDTTSTRGATRSPSAKAAPAAELGATVATRETSAGRYGLKVELFALRRTGRTLHANWRLSVLTAQGDDRFQVAGLFSDTDGRAADFSGDAADGVVLVDSTRARAHLAASDGQGKCVCSRDLASAVIPVNGSMVLGATYAAPSDEVTTMDVVMPRFGTFTGVPVQ